MKNRSRTAFAYASTGLLAAVLACSADVPNQAPQPVANGPMDSPYTFKFYAESGSSRTLVKVVPREVANAARAKGQSKGVSTKAGAAGLQPLDIHVADNGPPTSGSTTEPFIVTGPESLILGAAAQCGMVGDGNQLISDPNGPYFSDPTWADIVTQEKRGQTITKMQAGDLWSFNLQQGGIYTLNYGIFPSAPGNCDQMLEFEETLICVADQLAKLADTVSPLTWHAVQFLPQNQGNGPLAWVVPPPADSERFIVRDLAMEVLAELPLFDGDPYLSGLPGGTAPLTTTCSDAYGQIEANGTGTLNFATYPPFDSTQWKSESQERWAFESSNLRAAGQLLHDLIRESVYSDLAGSAANAAAQADPANGQALALGLKSGQAYNSLAHVGRVLMGRWDMDPPDPVFGGGNPDPQCRVSVRGGTADGYVIGPPNVTVQNATGVQELNLLPSFADAGTRARANDLGVLTKSQSLAATLFEEAGIVVADAQTQTTDLSSALLTQLEGIKGVAMGSTQDQALSQLVGSLNPADLARAVQHNSTTFSLITLQPTSSATALGPAATAAGLQLSSITNGALPNTAGVAIQGGLARGFVTTDPMARTGQMMVGSQCPEFTYAPNASVTAIMREDDDVPGAPNPAVYPYTPADGTTYAPLTPIFSRQDVFSVASAIRSRLVKLDAHASASSNSDPSSTAAQARLAAIAELGAWAGSGRMILSTDVSSATAARIRTPRKAFLDLVDVNPTDLGVSDLATLGNTTTAGGRTRTVLSLVVGAAKAAECAAGLTAASCTPTGELSVSAVSFGTFGAGVPTDAKTLRARFGVSNAGLTVNGVKNKGFVRLEFDVPGGVVGDGQGSFAGWDEPFYVVLAQDPSKAPGVGEILGTLSIPASAKLNLITDPAARPPPGLITVQYPEASTTLSPMRRELVTDAFGLGHWVGAAPPKAGDTPVSSTPSFCIEGVPRDIFVPLDNDLGNSNDSYENSWSHYLTLAQQAATNADTIGEELVNIGYENDVNLEGAGVQLMNITGNPTSTDGITIGPNGAINPGPQNGALSSLLNPAMFDVVFFTDDPMKGKTPTAAGLASAIGCSAGSSVALCQTLQGGSSLTVKSVLPGNAASLTGPNPPNTILYTYLGLAPPPSVSQSTTDPCSALTNSALAAKGLSGGSATASPQYQAATLFDPGAFGSGVAQWGGNATAAQQALSLLTMTVNADSSWQVTYGGSTVMDSTFGSSSWPGCLATGVCTWTSPFIRSLNDLFRWCPPGTDVRSALGACDGNVWAEVNSLRWRVAGTIWLAAMMSGGVPAGMFTSPMPVANFLGTTGPTQYAVPFNTVFSTGQFNCTTSGIVSMASGLGFQPEPGAQGELSSAVTVPMNSHWYASEFAGSHNSIMLPKWMTPIYINPAAPFPTTGNGATCSELIHLTASNKSGTSDFGGLNSFFSAIGAGGVSTQVDTPQWAAIAQQLGRFQCAQPTLAGSVILPGLPGSPNYGFDWPQGLIASLKTQQSTGSDMRSPYFFQPTTGLGLPYKGLMWTTYGYVGSSFVPELLPLNTSISPQDPFQPSGWPPAPGGWADQVPIRRWYLFNDWDDTWSPDQNAQNTTDLVNITSVPPEDRVPFVVNFGAPRDNCDAAWQFTQAVALSCLLSADFQENVTGTLQEPPSLHNLNDLTALTAWLDQAVQQSAAVLKGSYIVRVPAAVVANAVGVPGSISGNGGSVGSDIANAANGMIGIYQQWNNVQTSVQHVSDAMDEARDAIALAQDEASADDINNAISQLQTVKNIADDMYHIVQGISAAANLGDVVDPGAAAAGAAEAEAGAVGMASDTATLTLEQALEKNNQQQLADKISSTLTNLHDQVVSAGGDITNDVLALRQDANSVTSALEALASDASEASYYAGKASGADVWNCQGTSGQALECVSHVNTVLNRRYAGYQIRYQQALTQAKALGYIARRAVEQRIGIRLSDINTPIGPLDPPATWADQICSLQGINFENLNKEFPDAGSSAQQSQIDGQLAAQYANAFVGDWVQKLTDFVSYYNVTYPEQDGNDTAVLSMRETLLGGKPTCLGPAPNLLVDSSRLYALRDGSNASLASLAGWTRDYCATSDGTCLSVASSTAYPAPPGTGAGNVSWLSDQPRPPPVSGMDPANATALPNSPDGFVSQQVQLTTPGTYLLSWWDQARDLNGDPTTNPLGSYHVEIYDSAWNAVAGFDQAPAPSDKTANPPPWSDRRVLSFQIAAPDVFHIAFGAAGPSGAAGSVAIADVQLELASSSGAPTPYVDTGDNGQIVQYDCALSSADFRAAFQHNCDPDGTCHYDLSIPVQINTQAMTSNGMSLVGKFAAGNFNFRHVDVALNVVGTGVINCTQTGSPDCFGSAYLTYTLNHVGDDVGVLGYDGQYRTFDFGTAVMDHAKALTAERYLTVPLSSNDQQLVSQFLQSQFRGRPIDGVYNLKIYDNPALNWNQVQDIQMLLNYHYWSKITPSKGSN